MEGVDDCGNVLMAVWWEYERHRATLPPGGRGHTVFLQDKNTVAK